LAYHDTLTGLVNRMMVNHRLAQVFTKWAGQRRVGVCLLDLDEFQAVYDSLGRISQIKLVALGEVSGMPHPALPQQCDLIYGVQESPIPPYDA
jgi:predicted signal transduction protein with EAL and GGDEF domain